MSPQGPPSRQYHPSGTTLVVAHTDLNRLAWPLHALPRGRHAPKRDSHRCHRTLSDGWYGFYASPHQSSCGFDELWTRPTDRLIDGLNIAPLTQAERISFACAGSLRWDGSSGTYITQHVLTCALKTNCFPWNIGRAYRHSPPRTVQLCRPHSRHHLVLLLGCDCNILICFAVTQYLDIEDIGDNDAAVPAGRPSWKITETTF